jgi:hypothetical protein
MTGQLGRMPRSAAIGTSAEIQAIADTKNHAVAGMVF